MSVPIELTQELERLGARYGPAVVREEAKRLLKGKRGNTTKPDLVRLRTVFEADALEILEGRDPTKTRTNYAVAKEFARRFPDKTVAIESPEKRIAKKLRKHRLKFAARGAFWIAEEKHAFRVCLNIYEKYAQYQPIPEDYIKTIFDSLELYRNLIGAPPEEMTVGEIRERLKRWNPAQPGNFLTILKGLSGH